MGAGAKVMVVGKGVTDVRWALREEMRGRRLTATVVPERENARERKSE